MQQEIQTLPANLKNLWNDYYQSMNWQGSWSSLNLQERSILLSTVNYCITNMTCRNLHDFIRDSYLGSSIPCKFVLKWDGPSSIIGFTEKFKEVINAKKLIIKTEILQEIDNLKINDKNSYCVSDEINYQDKFGDTTLMIMARRGSTFAPLIKIMIEKGADPNIKNKQGKTALQIAKDYGNDEIVNILSKI